MDTPRLTRRDTLKIGAFGAAVVALPLSTTLAAQGTSAFDVRSLKPYSAKFEYPQAAQQSAKPEAWAGKPVDFYRMEQRMVEAEIIPGYKTTLFAYGTVNADGSNWQGGVPGPTVRATRGRKVVMRMRNGLPHTHPTLGYEAWTSCHLHGSPSKPQFDGYASDITRPTRDGKSAGQWKDYEYENQMTPRTLWYHDHGVHHTAENAYMGLAAQYHCVQEDVNLSGVKLPKTFGTDDFPLMVADKSFAAPKTVNGVKRAELLFDDAGHSNTFGDVITVNGKAWPYMEVRPKVYRFRFLNAGLSRSYMVALSNNAEMALIALDGGFMKKVKRVKQFRAGMAERFEILIDFSNAANQTINMVNKGTPNSPNFEHTDKIMQFRVGPPLTDAEKADPAVVTVLPAHDKDLWVPKVDADPAKSDKDPMSYTTMTGMRRNLELTRNNGQWTVGPYTWEEVIESDYSKAFATVEPGKVEDWTVKNSSGGWFHPVHIHLVDFQIMSRNGGKPHPWEEGPKDVVYVGENETVVLRMKFHAEDQGRYMIHCHNLTHEDHDMMTQFRVGTEKNTKDLGGLPATEDGKPVLDHKGEQVYYDKDCDPVYAAHPTWAEDK